MNQRDNNFLWGLSLQVASAIAFMAIAALFLIASNTICSLFTRRITGKKRALPPCLCDEWKALRNASANPTEPASKVDNIVSHEEMTDFYNDAVEIHLPEELIMDVLSRLPVQSLHRFSCASKYWKTLISGPYFAKKHFIRAKNNQNSKKFLISRICIKDDMTLFYSSSLSLVQSSEDVQKLDCPSNNKRLYAILCCCDGLFLLWTHSELLLWNPSTGQSIVLPNPEFRTSPCTYGMGYDSASDDYKILKIEKPGCFRKTPYEILELKSGLWRKINQHPRCLQDRFSGKDSLAFFHGAFHWIGGDRSCKYFIVTFSISNEVYGEIPLPDNCIGGMPTMNHARCGVSVLGGLLCTYYTDWNLKVGTFKLWVMKDYGIKESWTALFTIIEPHLSLMIPRYRFADGEVLLYFKKGENNGFRTSKGPFGVWPPSHAVQQVFAFTESLISPRLLI